MHYNRVKKTRERRGIKQAALAAAAGISQSELSRIEAGTREPGVYVAIKLAQSLGTRVEEIFEDK